MTTQEKSRPAVSAKALRWRIVLALLAAALLPLVISGLGSWVVFRDMLQQKSLELMTTVVQGHSDAIDVHLAARIHLLEFAARSRPIEEVSSNDRLQRLLDNLNYSSDNGFFDLGVIDTSGNHLAYVGPYDLTGKNYRETDWFREVMVSGAYISDVFLGYRKLPHCIIAVKGKTGDLPWILRATINSDQFDRLVESTDLGAGSLVWVVNQEGLYQTSSPLGSLLEKAHGLDVKHHYGVLQQKVEVEGRERIRATTWINGDRWMLGVEQDLSTVLAPVDRAIANVTQVVAIAVFILILATFFATSHLTTLIDKANAGRDEMTRAFMRSAKLASVGELATGLAHEINNPLAVISAEQTNISDLIRESDTNPGWMEQTLNAVERSREQVRRCAGITRKMLQFGRKREPDSGPVDVAQTCEAVVQLLRRHTAVRNVRIESDIESNLPRIQADRIELEQVLVNLVNNAVDAMPDGGTIRVKAYRDGTNVHIEVVDNGKGIAPAEIERIFEPFYTTKPPGKGTGLGLSVCYGIVQSWGGRIRAESSPGKGTAVHIHLPVHRVSGG